MKIEILCRNISLLADRSARRVPYGAGWTGQAHVPTFSFRVVKPGFMTADVTQSQFLSRMYETPSGL